jgi:hypothetical protein
METGMILELESTVTLRNVDCSVDWVKLKVPDFPCWRKHDGDSRTVKNLKEYFLSYSKALFQAILKKKKLP